VSARELPNGDFFYSPLGLFDFQADAVAEVYVRTNPGQQSGILTVYDTGIGKTIIGIALAAFLFQDNQIDYVMVICEKNKLTDWQKSFEQFSNLGVHLYHGNNRQKRLSKDPAHHVFITSYETGRNELVFTQPGRGRARRSQRTDSPLVETLGLPGKRILWIFDEVTKLRSRSSATHQAYTHLLHELRKGPHHQRALGLTATPMERDFEDSYNLARVICPERMPTVAVFEDTFSRGRDDYGRLRLRGDREQLFAQLFQGLIMRKRKTDQDVIDQFPRQIEESILVDQSPDFADLYDTIASLFDPPEGMPDPRTEDEIQRDERRLYSILRMTAGHPASHLHATNEISQAIVAQLGEECLRTIGSPKTGELLALLKPLVFGQGAQVVIFTFFARTVLPEIVGELRKAGFAVGQYHGGQSLHANERSKEDFLSGRIEILVCSDAGARGLNLGNAAYVVEYESALTYAMRTQRINRVNRIDSQHSLVTCYTMVLQESIEDGIINRVLDRNQRQDILLGDEDDGSAFIPAATRREILKITRKRRGKK
jgi:SNF2 family DNA or RNA helicase